MEKFTLGRIEYKKIKQMNLDQLEDYINELLNIRNKQPIDTQTVIDIYYKVFNNIEITDDELCIIDNYFLGLTKFKKHDLIVLDKLSGVSYFTDKYKYSLDNTLLVSNFLENASESVIDKLHNILFDYNDNTLLSGTGLMLLMKIAIPEFYDNKKVESKPNISSVDNQSVKSNSLSLKDFSTADWSIESININSTHKLLHIKHHVVFQNQSILDFTVKFTAKSSVSKSYLKKYYLDIEDIAYTSNGKTVAINAASLNFRKLMEIANSKYEQIELNKMIVGKLQGWLGVNKPTIQKKILKIIKDKVSVVVKVNDHFIVDYCDKKISFNCSSKTANVKIGELISLTYFDDDGKILKELNLRINTNKNIAPSKSNDHNNDKGFICLYDSTNHVTRYCEQLGHELIQRIIKCHSKKNPNIDVNVYYCKQCNLFYLRRTLYNQYKNYKFDYEFVDTPIIKTDVNSEIKPNFSNSNVKNINIEDFLVRTSLNKCVNNNHTLSRIKACVSIITKSNGIIEETFDAAYCSECNKSYILESTYNRLKKLGQICCKVIEYEDLKQNYSSFSSWQKKSLLAMYGYNVNKNESLTVAERHMILDFIIENNIMRPFEIISHLEMLIRTRKNLKNMADAREKWEDDIRYVQNYNEVNDYVRVKSIFAKR